MALTEPAALKILQQLHDFQGMRLLVGWSSCWTDGWTDEQMDG
jgi:hypothetical protein